MVKYTKKRLNISHSCVLVSECIKNKRDHYICRFYGTYKGKLIKNVEVKSDIGLKVNEIYILYLEVSNVRDFTLCGVARKVKVLEEYSWI